MQDRAILSDSEHVTGPAAPDTAHAVRGSAAHDRPGGAIVVQNRAVAADSKDIVGPASPDTTQYVPLRQRILPLPLCRGRERQATHPCRCRQKHLPRPLTCTKDMRHPHRGHEAASFDVLLSWDTGNPLPDPPAASPVPIELRANTSDRPTAALLWPAVVQKSRKSHTK
jgi:hypothetical protein